MKKIFLVCLFFQILVMERFLLAQNDSPTIKTERMEENLYKFFIYLNGNNSVNIYALIGNDGVLLIDSGYDNTTDLVKSELKKLTDNRIRYIINTHADGDHTYGNAALGKDAVIVSHELCRTRLLTDAQFSKSGLPHITIQDSAQIFFNGEEISLKYLPGHTATDIIVHFIKSNIVFLGDLVLSDSFPLVHPDGNIYTLEKNIDLLSKMFFDNTRIFVGHGRDLKTTDLVVYHDMFARTKELVTKAIREKITPDEAKRSDLLKDWKNWNSKLFAQINTDRWIDNIYSVTDEGKEFSAFYSLSKILDKSGLSVMLAEYKKMISSDGQTYYFLEAEFNNWGYTLLGRQKYNEAIEIFKMNVERYPESWNAYDSLGEAYMITGNNSMAIENYEKSLNLNPNSPSGIDALKKLKQNN